MSALTFFHAPLQHLLAWAVGTAVICAMVLWALLKTGLAWQLATDVPNDRSLHTLPTPRAGAWGLVPVALAGIWMAAPELRVIAAIAAMLAVLSVVDDRRGLPARVRFCGHVAGVIALLLFYPASVPWWVAIGVAVVLVWMVNLYNFMDGADGLAGGMTFFGFAGYAAAALLSPHPLTGLAVAALSVAGASLGFLAFNFHPARIFLGDAGSISVGFLAGAIGYWGWAHGTWPAWMPPLLFSPFIADASITLLKRLLRGEKFWQAHREHYYQRMIRSGMGHGQTALFWYVVMAAGCGLALLGLPCAPATQWAIVAAWGSVLVCLGRAVDTRWSRFLKLSKEKVKK